jgi:hypothetical protein
MRLPRPWLLVLLAALAAAPGPRPAAGQDATKPEEESLGPPPPPLTPEQDKAARALFAKAKELVKAGQGIPARVLFEEFLKKYPGADEDLVSEADDRSGPNFLAGIELQHDAGPSARRLDVELMGDGYTLEKFRYFKAEALSQMKEFWREPLFAEYEDYINVWRFDLVSKEEGVDDVSPEERGMPRPDDPRARKRYDKKMKRTKRYSTALDCKAAGPARQVWANPDQVLRWRQYLEGSDGYTIAFARKGELGMGGGGIATTGKKVAVVHEFGHAFGGLLDEYTNNPSRPDYRIWAPNSVSTDDPDPRKIPAWNEVPWAHWFRVDGKPIVNGVVIRLGGATYTLGAFRPADGCAMNGGGPYCWVCREASLLKLYSFVSPIDESGPNSDTIRLGPGETKELFVVPMQPKTHDLKVTWTIQVVAAMPEPVASMDGPVVTDDLSYVQDERASGMWQPDGDRAAKRRANPLPEGTPPGAPLKAVRTKTPKGGARWSVVLGEKLPPGFYKVTARVVDDAVVPGQPRSWIAKDADRLLEEWRSWNVEVLPAAAAPAPVGPTPPPGGK